VRELIARASTPFLHVIVLASFRISGRPGMFSNPKVTLRLRRVARSI
jgi:hypothetical protein